MNNLKKIFKYMSILILFCPYLLSAQIGIGTSNPVVFLDVSTKNKLNPSDSVGISVPTVDTLEVNAKRFGQMVYHSKDSSLYYYHNSDWYSLRPPLEYLSFGDIKMAFDSADHIGWVLLDGRSVNTLSETQRHQAILLGFTTHIPNAENKTLKAKGAVGITGGQDSIFLSQTHMPNTTINGTTDADGVHNHDYEDTRTSSSGTNIGGGGGAGAQNPVYTTNTRTTTNEGLHSHTLTISSPGGNQALNTMDAYLSTNAFIYLGE